MCVFKVDEFSKHKWLYGTFAGMARQLLHNFCSDMLDIKEAIMRVLAVSVQHGLFGCDEIWLILFIAVWCKKTYRYKKIK